ncbi:MAG: tetratricopeptide repeat protein, partial [Pseudomonadota bacterium]
LMFAEANRSSRKPTEDLQAYDLVLRALPHLIRVPTLADFRAGIALLDAAIARDPKYALAKAWKVRSYLVARGGRLISMAEFHEISPLAEALVNDYGNDPLVLAFASVAHGFGSDHQDEAAQAARRAVQLSPNSGLVMTSAGWPISYVAAYEEAIGCFERGIRLDPLGHTVGQCRVGIGGCLGFMGRYDDAVAILEQANADAPEYGTTVQGLIINYWAAGRHDDARRMADVLRRMVADLTITSVLPTSPYRRPEQQALLIDAFRGVGIPD